jgi:hypothetical protein
MTKAKRDGGIRMRGPKITFSVRDISPCKGCTEKFLGCHDRCPKDARGEPGYKAFREEIARVKAARAEYEKTKMR